jgi:hypothetical protein
MTPDGIGHDARDKSKQGDHGERAGLAQIRVD